MEVGLMTKYEMLIYWSEEDQSYIAEVPELAGCMADGSSYQEAVSNAERVIAEWIDTAIEQGRYIPESKGRRLFTQCCSIARKHPLGVVICIMLVVFSFYFANFHNGLSEKNEVWGTFGDYVGGILNPVIAAFAFYLIAKTYELQIKAYDLQKTELEETRKLLKVSTDAQNDQVKLAALTALISTNLARIDFLNFEKTELLNALVVKPNAIDTRSIEELGAFEEGVEKGYYREDYPVRQRVRKIYGEIKCLTDKTNKFEEQIEVLLKGKAE